jgi:hypothetical protein
MGGFVEIHPANHRLEATLQYAAVCSCNWQEFGFTSEESAQQAGDAHVEEAQRTDSDWNGVHGVEIREAPDGLEEMRSG